MLKLIIAFYILLNLMLHLQICIIIRLVQVIYILSYNKANLKKVIYINSK
jgi:hypothetical protein